MIENSFLDNKNYDNFLCTQKRTKRLHQQNNKLVNNQLQLNYILLLWPDFLNDCSKKYDKNATDQIEP